MKRSSEAFSLFDAALPKIDHLNPSKNAKMSGTFVPQWGSNRKGITMRHKIYVILATCLVTTAASVSAQGQAISQVCTPKVIANTIVVSSAQRSDAGLKAEPPLTGPSASFDWPDTPLGVIKTSGGYEFFGSDGGQHSRQLWQGEWVGNNKSGSGHHHGHSRRSRRLRRSPRHQHFA